MNPVQLLNYIPPGEKGYITKYSFPPNQDMPYGISDNRLQARFKRLIPEVRAHIKGEDPNRSFHR